MAMKPSALISNPKAWPKKLSEEVICEAAYKAKPRIVQGHVMSFYSLEHHDCEPDARNYECDGCGEKQVFGAEELLMCIA